MPHFTERYAKQDKLLHNLVEQHADLKRFLDNLNSEHSRIADCFYRYYHHSFKVFNMQEQTLKVVERLKELFPGEPLNGRFLSVLEAGTNKSFQPGTNTNWENECLPIVHAALHARYFLELAVDCAEELKNEEKAPNILPSKWAALLYLFDIR